MLKNVTDHIVCNFIFVFRKNTQTYQKSWILGSVETLFWRLTPEKTTNNVSKFIKPGYSDDGVVKGRCYENRAKIESCYSNEWCLRRQK